MVPAAAPDSDEGGRPRAPERGTAGSMESSAAASWGAAPNVRDVRIAIPEDVEHDPEVVAVLAGRMAETRPFRILTVFLFLLCVALPVLLLALAAGLSNDTVRGAQVAWAIALFVVGLALFVPLRRTHTVVTKEGIEKTSGFSTIRIPWEEVSCFVGQVGMRRGLWVVPWASNAVQIPTRWHYNTPELANAAATRANTSFGMTARAHPDHAATVVTAVGMSAAPPDADAINDPEVQRLLTGRVLWSRGFWWLVLWLSPFVVVLPTILLVIGVTSDTMQDSSYRAQINWAIVLYLCFVATLLCGALPRSRADERGVWTRGFGRFRLFTWGHVQAFVPGGPSGVAFLTTERKRVSVQAGLGGSRKNADSLGFLNRTLHRGIPLAFCIRCQQQFQSGTAASPAMCSYHPADPVRLGDVGEGEGRPSRWVFPCCNKVVFAARGSDGEELVPSVAAGCVTGPHVEPPT